MTNLIKFIAFSCVVLLSGASQADWFLSSETKRLIAQGEGGDANAQFQVGYAYDSGKGAPSNREEALRWYTMAAERGHLEAQNSLGSLFQEQKKYDLARSW